MLSWFGYQAGAGTAQPDLAIWGIKAMVILIPAIIAMGSWASFKFIWNIDDKERAKVAAWKAEKAAKNADAE